MDDFRVLADTLEAEIRSGQLRPGTRLAPQREFARSRGIATSTAARVYQELERRGLVSGEVGRGTFVLSGQSQAAADARRSLIDLEANFPVLPEQGALVTRTLTAQLTPAALTAAMRPVGPAGSRVDREAAARYLARDRWTPDPADVLFTGSGRQAISAAVAALTTRRRRLGVEELTYPVVKAIAANLGVTLVPIGMDEDGLVPTDLARIHREEPLDAIYLQPTLHNPLGITMPPARRGELAELLVALDLTAVEDGVNCFLRDDAPLAHYAPVHAVYLDSLSKRIAPGLNLGIMVAPRPLRETLAGAIRSGVWTANGFALATAGALIADRTATEIVARKRADAAARQAVVLGQLAGFTLRADPRAYHAWWELPSPWQAETFVAAAARQGIAISPAAAFAAGPTTVRAVRLSNSSPSLDELRGALDVLAELARRTPEDSGVDY